MRNTFVKEFLETLQPDDVFLTGDVGYNSLEPVQAILKDRFINCGIAEQNMVSMAAGLAKAGLRPWVYSIAPFIFARAYEQIRNDVVHHLFRVNLVGTADYPVLGFSHSSSEDFDVLRTLRPLMYYDPKSVEEVKANVRSIRTSTVPTYLRLGRIPNGK
jgi:transketolase